MLLNLSPDLAQGVEMCVIVVMNFLHKPGDCVGSCVA